MNAIITGDDIYNHVIITCHFRILCTHHLRFLNKADQIIALENGQVRYLGTSAEVLPRVTDLVGSEEKEETETLERDRDGYTTGIVHQVCNSVAVNTISGAGSSCCPNLCVVKNVYMFSAF